MTAAMKAIIDATEGPDGAAAAYRLDDQIGFLLRRATQRHLSIFSARLPDLTPTQLAVLAKLHEQGPASQNQLGRETAMDAATVKGVIDRLARRGLVATRPSAEDRRRLRVSLTEEGRALFADAAGEGLAISQATLAPLAPDDRRRLIDLLRRIA